MRNWRKWRNTIKTALQEQIFLSLKHLMACSLPGHSQVAKGPQLTMKTKLTTRTKLIMRMKLGSFLERMTVHPSKTRQGHQTDSVHNFPKGKGFEMSAHDSCMI